jgi:hypothetical protein
MQKDFMAMAQGKGSEQEVTQKLVKLFQESGVADMYQGPQKQQEFMTLVQSLAKAFMNQDSETIQNHPLIQMLQQVIPGGKEWQQEAQTQMPQQGQEQPAATKDFASMMPPSGGGLPGL